MAQACSLAHLPTLPLLRPSMLLQLANPSPRLLHHPRYDCVWSEENENILVSASGDGSIKVRRKLGEV